ncbi:hypothetical protein K435DRAFT_974000 [Dendrothele bispora CBS 962.96]|uniref:C2H2-type domain-containing protein n=1 Tax=Dendrothele bispora (strain CBS 962.96) TaxID=1314807 RepID=A0A4S8KP22_DENBC|nr:hypothetical protein K435DRAFT_974000 [Dendrothele bispora CBS 962.96]
MSSWSSSYPPPPRRSRSRSPRGSYLPRDSAYPPDSYRDWEYDRDRNWSTYDRGYEYGRRGRSRSPVDETNRKRRRSPSPYDRDRYEPRPRYNDDYDTHSRGYGYSPTRRGLPPGRRQPPDPYTFDYPASLKQYADWFRYFFPQQAQEEDNADKAAEHEANDGSKPRNGIKSRWEKYKKEFAASQLQTMFDHHKKSPWFWEKYNPAPEFARLRARVRKEGWRGRLSTFLHDLESGKFDPDLNEPEIEPPSAATDNVANGEKSTSEANNNVDEPKANVDDDMQFNIDAEDDGVDNENRGDTNGKAGGGDSKRNNKGEEEMAVSPEGNQVMIRTIPPDIGRVKLEESIKTIPGFVHLALGDPLQKRNYYRAGWIRFTDDADMLTVMTELQERKIEGFKLHVSHNTKPFVNKIRYAPEVASRPERMEKDLANARALASILEEEAAKLRRTKIELLETIKSEGEGEGEGEDAPMEEIPENEDGDEEEPAERGSDAVDRRVEKVMADMRDQGLVDPSDETAYEIKRTEVALDLYVEYLRASFHACYYCSVVTDHVEELQRKCVKHVRKPLLQSPSDEKSVDNEKDKKLTEDDQEEKPTEKEVKKENKRPDRTDDRWLEWLDSKIALLINRDNVDPREYGGKKFDEELSKVVEPHIKQEDEGKFRCRTCSKLFKATSYVEKHIANKHSELVKALDEIPYFNNFALDPHRIQPFAHPPPAVGNSQQAPPQAFGIQVQGNHAQYHPGYPPAGYAPLPPGNGYWPDQYPPKGHFYDPMAYPGMAPPRRDETANSRRLSDRISGYVDIPANAGLPPKPPPAALDSALSSGNGNQRKGRSGQQAGGPPPPPPPDAKEDPRAAAGRRVSYHDMDLVAEGDVELSY